MKNVEIDTALRVSGVLLTLGIGVEMVSLWWEKPLAFLLFVAFGGLFTGSGMAFYLYSLLPPRESQLPKR
jgi:hypothetical protein